MKPIYINAIRAASRDAVDHPKWNNKLCVVCWRQADDPACGIRAHLRLGIDVVLSNGEDCRIGLLTGWLHAGPCATIYNALPAEMKR